MTVQELEAECDALRESINAVRAEYLQKYMDASARADARVSVELLNIERETCDRIRSDNDCLRAERDAIRAKTIEECAKVMNGLSSPSVCTDPYQCGYNGACADGSAAIRSLKEKP